MSTDHSAQLVSFYNFLGEHLRSAPSERTPEELLHEWRIREEREQVIADVTQGTDDFEAGRGASVEQAFANVRQMLRERE